MPLMNGWNNIPNGSMLHVTLDPDTPFGITGTHTVNTANGPVLEGKITNGHFPLEIPINTGDQHIVDFQLLFAGTPVAIEVVARVEEPDGSTFQSSSSETAHLSGGDRAFQVTLVANG